MMISAKKSGFKRISTIIITIFFVICTFSLVITKVVYDRIFVRYDVPADIPAALSTTQQQRQTCQFPSGENLLAGYYYPAPTPNPANALVVLVPGFHAGSDDYLWQIQELLEYGWSIFAFDTTGTFRSGGESQIGFSQSLLDLEAALNYLRKNQLLGHAELVLMGHSRGAYAACCALESEKDVAAVVSISGVNSAMEAIMQMSVQSVGPASYCNYGFLWLYQASLFGADTLEQSAAQAISGSRTPVLVIHGNKDTQIPADAASILSHKPQISSSQVEYLLCDAGHNDILYDTDGTANDALLHHINDFLLRSLTA